ncbi:MAG: hypothetical protein C4583_14975 [Anaerolineaceae bacterium]|nr:MAG: hypothetical protein C4583_14975 [Anaerolineaceae bacterium]
MSDVEIGKVTHYFDHLNVAVLALTSPLNVGETIHIHGHSTDFKQTVTSLQIKHQSVQSAKQGDDVAIKVEHIVHPHDKVFKIE